MLTRYRTDDSWRSIGPAHDWRADFGLAHYETRDFRPGLTVLPMDLGRRNANISRMATGITLETAHAFGDASRDRPGDAAINFIFDAAVEAGLDVGAFYAVPSPPLSWTPEDCIVPLGVIPARAARRLHRQQGGDRTILQLVRAAGAAGLLIPGNSNFLKAPPFLRNIAERPDMRPHLCPSGAAAPIYEPKPPRPATPPRQAARDFFAKVAKGTMIPYLLRKGRGE